jgi:membrane protein
MTKAERIIRNTAAFRFLRDRSKRIILPGFRGVPLYDVIKFFILQVSKTSLTERASAISYNFIMAVPPACLFLFTLLPQLPYVKKRVVLWQLHGLIRDIIPAPDYNRGIIQFIDGFFTHQRSGLLSFGFVLLLFFASNGMIGIMRSFNKNYIGFQHRSGLRNRWIAIRLTVIIMGLLFACLLLLVMQGAILRWLGIENAIIRQTIMMVRWVVIIGLVLFSIGFIYKFAPAIHRRWHLFSPGTILATSLSIIATIGFSVFLNNFAKYNALYGSIGTVIVFMIIIYINSLALLIGYELNVSIHSLQLMAEEREQKEIAGQ